MKRIHGSVFNKRGDIRAELASIEKALAAVDSFKAVAATPGWDALTTQLSGVVTRAERQIMEMASNPDKYRDDIVRTAAYIKAITLVVNIVENAAGRSEELKNTFATKRRLLQGTIEHKRTRPSFGQFAEPTPGQETT